MIHIDDDSLPARVNEHLGVATTLASSAAWLARPFLLPAKCTGMTLRDLLLGLSITVTGYLLLGGKAL